METSKLIKSLSINLLKSFNRTIIYAKAHVIGMRVAILRPRERIRETVEKFEKEGFDVIAIPFIRIVKTDFDLDVDEFDAVVITSKTAAEIFIERGLKHRNIIAIGRKTAELLISHGMQPKVPSRFDSKTLFEEFRDELEGSKVALLRSDRGDRILLNIPNAKEFVIYRIEFEWGKDQMDLIRNLNFDAIVFSSRMIVRSFFELAKNMGLYDHVAKGLREKTVVALGPPTRDELKRFGIKAVMPDEWTFDSVLNLLKEIKLKKQTR